LEKFEETLESCSNVDTQNIDDWYKFRELMTDVEQTFVFYGSDVLYNDNVITSQVDEAIQHFKDGDEKRFGYQVGRILSNNKAPEGFQYNFTLF